MPEDSDPGKDFDVVCSFKAMPGGTLRMTLLGNTPMPEPERRYNQPKFDDLVKSMNDQANTEPGTKA